MPAISLLGCGWLGQPLGEALIKKSYHVIGSTTSSDKLAELKSRGIEPIILNIGPSPLIEETGHFFQSKVLIVTLPFRRQLANPLDYRDQMKTVGEAAQAGGVQWVLLTSSTSVYPRGTRVALEGEDFIPDTPRAEALLAAEQVLQSNKNFSTTILRLAGLYGGERRMGNFLVGRKNLAGGSQPVNLVHRDDVVRIIVKVIELGLKDKIFNVVSDGHPTREELYVKAAEMRGLSVPEFQTGEPETRKIVSNEKICQTLNYQFIHPDPLRYIMESEES